MHILNHIQSAYMFVLRDTLISPVHFFSIFVWPIVTDFLMNNEPVMFQISFQISFCYGGKPTQKMEKNSNF